jgi:Flp pilus assembly pilin Flp
MKAFANFANKEDGATAAEYALMIGLIITAIFLSVQTLGNTLNGIFTTAASWYSVS